MISPLIIAITGIALLLVLIALGMHIAGALGLVGILGMIALHGFHFTIGVGSMVPYDVVSNYAYLVIPLFILMGNFALYAGVTSAAYEVGYKWFGRLPGGLAGATVFACAAFAAVCGSSPATVATIGAVAYPEMKKHKYDTKLAVGCIASAGALGILIPPSVAMVIIAIVTNQSIGRLLIAGILPGLLTAIMFIAMISIRAAIQPSLGPRARGITWKESITSLKNLWKIFILFLVVVGGIYSGLITSTEAAALGALAAFIMILISRLKNKWRNIIQSVTDAGRMTGMIFFIFIGSMLFTHFLSLTQLPTTIAEAIAHSNIPPLLLLAICLTFYIPLGMFMDGISMILVTIPVIWPSLIALGYNPILLAVLLVVVIEIGNVTPPVGLNCYVAAKVAKDVPLETVFAGIWWFVFVQLLVVVILIAFPEITLWLPNLVFFR